MKRVWTLIEAASDALSAQLAHFAAEVNARTARIEQTHYYRGYEAGFNDARDPILAITPEDVGRARGDANTWIESEDEYTVR